MNTPGIPPDVQAWLQQNPQLQQTLSAVGGNVSQFTPIAMTNPDGTPGAPLNSQQPQQGATMGGPQQQWFVPPTANGIWAKPGMSSPGIWGAGPAGSGGAGPGVA